MSFKDFPNIIFATSKISDGNMDLRFGDINQTLENRKRFFKTLGSNIDQVIELNQVHGNEIVYVKDLTQNNLEADGLITNIPNLFLMIKAADCHQIGFYDLNNQAIGLIHAGWRGLEKGVIKNAVNKMAQKFGSNPKGLIVQFGPAIGPCCYRVDIWQQAEDQLINASILKENIHNPKICTYENKDRFSHRKSADNGLEDLRFVTILGMKK